MIAKPPIVPHISRKSSIPKAIKTKMTVYHVGTFCSSCSIQAFGHVWLMRRTTFAATFAATFAGLFGRNEPSLGYLKCNSAFLVSNFFFSSPKPSCVVPNYLVIVKIKPDADPAQAEAMLAAIITLKNDIPQVQKVTGGTNFSERSQGFEHGRLALCIIAGVWYLRLGRLGFIGGVDKDIA